ncbi:Hypothetical predicted protein [Octopus vulgaris]|uniref:MULE transposase domain-containing protein n=1 Tax=Octopus vulgaris TaxID=6645 RepID=A0AA36B7X7_OCTVU|nr:Hypothetical predicted protein [Octopus vulgaris]
MENMKENALKSQLASRSLIGAACGELENEGRSLMTSTSSLSRNIRNGDKKKKTTLLYLDQDSAIKVTDIGLKMRYQTDCDFNTKVKCLMALAFIPPLNTVDAFIELVDDNDLPQERVAYFEKHSTSGERRKVPPTFPIGLWNMYERTLNQLANTNNGVEGFHNALQASVTNTQPKLW